MKNYGCIILLAAMVVCLLLGQTQSAFAAQPTFSGLWNTNMGELQIEIAGNKLTGVFPLTSRKIEGSVVGMKSGGTWSEPPSFKPPNDAGRFEVLLAADGKKFTGKIFDSSGKEAGIIEAQRPVEPDVALSGTWSTSVGDVALKREGTQFSGFHYGLQAVISGSIEANGKIAFSVIKQGKVMAKVIGSFVGNGRTFKGWWNEPPTYSPPDEAGRVVFEFLPEGSFNGTIYNGQDKAGLVINGNRK
jgi:hypothetical protein